MTEARVGQIWRDTLDNEEVLLLAKTGTSFTMKVVREKDERIGDQRALGFVAHVFNLSSTWVLSESSMVNEILNHYD